MVLMRRVEVGAKLLDLSRFHPHITRERLWPILRTVTLIMFPALFTSTINALIAICAAKLRPQISPGTMTVAIRTSKSSRKLPRKKLFVRKPGKGALSKRSATTAPRHLLFGRPNAPFRARRTALLFAKDGSASGGAHEPAIPNYRAPNSGQIAPGVARSRELVL